MDYGKLAEKRLSKSISEGLCARVVRDSLYMKETSEAPASFVIIDK